MKLVLRVINFIGFYIFIIIMYPLHSSSAILQLHVVKLLYCADTETQATVLISRVVLYRTAIAQLGRIKQVCVQIGGVYAY